MAALGLYIYPVTFYLQTHHFFFSFLLCWFCFGVVVPKIYITRVFIIIFFFFQLGFFVVVILVSGRHLKFMIIDFLFTGYAELT